MLLAAGAAPAWVDGAVDEVQVLGRGLLGGGGGGDETRRDERGIGAGHWLFVWVGGGRKRSWGL